MDINLIYFHVAASEIENSLSSLKVLRYAKRKEDESRNVEKENEEKSSKRQLRNCYQRQREMMEKKTMVMTTPANEEYLSEEDEIIWRRLFVERYKNESKCQMLL